MVDVVVVDGWELEGVRWMSYHVRSESGRIRIQPARLEDMIERFVGFESGNAIKDRVERVIDEDLGDPMDLSNMTATNRPKKGSPQWNS